MSGPFKMRGISPLSKKTKTSSKKSDAPKKKIYATDPNTIYFKGGKPGQLGLKIKK